MYLALIQLQAEHILSYQINTRHSWDNLSMSVQEGCTNFIAVVSNPSMQNQHRLHRGPNQSVVGNKAISRKQDENLCSFWL